MRSSVVFLAVLLFPWTPGASQETVAGYLQEEYSCVMCHTDKRTDFLEGVHSRRGIQCTDCHGGDPTKFDVDGAHSGEFRGALSKAGAVDLCLSCHGDIPQMRQYALEPVTREEFLVSMHGRLLLLEGDTLAPSCGDCHGTHAILPRADPRSPVNSAKISETCARCHSDPLRVPEDIPHNQFEEWEESAHGAALEERHNEESAQCASCHGSHSALPPGVREIPNVCGKCHQLVREAYFQGPHGLIGSESEGIPCTGCHANHKTEMPSLSEIGALCLSCHETDSPEATAGLQLQEQVVRAEAAGARARAAMEVIANAGESVEDEEVRLLTVETHLQELLVQAHTLDPAVLDELVRKTSTLATEIGERADVVGEQRWERKLLAIPAWVLLVGGILLAGRKRRHLRRLAQEETDKKAGGSES